MVKDARTDATCVTGIDYSREKVKSSRNSHDAGFVNRIHKIIELEQSINNDMNSLVVLKMQTKQLIKKMPNEKQRIVLQLRYINLVPWKDIAETINCSIYHCHKIHRAALELLDEILKLDKKDGCI